MAKITTKDGVGHKITKKKSNKGIGDKGDIIVDHTATKSGKYDKMDLTKVAGSKTVKQGIKATRDWHNKHPQKKGKK
jgi:hypothetical protein